MLLGPPGVGKTHIAISLAIAAAQRGRRVYYGTLIDLITSLEEAQAAGNLARRLAVLTHPSLLVVDEIGYLPINHAGAVLFFQLMNRRYERASTVLTSNKGFEEMGRRARRRRDGRRAHRPGAAPLPPGQHPRQQLSHACAHRPVPNAASRAQWRRDRQAHPPIQGDRPLKHRKCAIFARHNCDISVPC